MMGEKRDGAVSPPFHVQEVCRLKREPFRPFRTAKPFRPGIVAVAAAVVLCAAVPLVTMGLTSKAAATQAVSSSGSTGTSSASADASAVSETPLEKAAAALPDVQVSLAQAVKPLRVEVDLGTQNVVVYDAQNRVVEAFVCSSGVAGSDTPTGTYTVSDRGYSFYNSKYKEGAYYWVRFNGSYLFHSVPFDANKQIVQTQVEKLGEPSSNGCIHLSMDNAIWIYKNIPRGTQVVVKN